MACRFVRYGNPGVLRSRAIRLIGADLFELLVCGTDHHHFCIDGGHHFLNLRKSDHTTVEIAE